MAPSHVRSPWCDLNAHWDAAQTLLPGALWTDIRDAERALSCCRDDRTTVAYAEGFAEDDDVLDEGLGTLLTFAVKIGSARRPEIKRVAVRTLGGECLLSADSYTLRDLDLSHPRRRGEPGTLPNLMRSLLAKPWILLHPPGRQSLPPGQLSAARVARGMRAMVEALGDKWWGSRDTDEVLALEAQVLALEPRGGRRPGIVYSWTDNRCEHGHLFDVCVGRASNCRDDVGPLRALHYGVYFRATTKRRPRYVLRQRSEEELCITDTQFASFDNLLAYLAGRMYLVALGAVGVPTIG